MNALHQKTMTEADILQAFYDLEDKAGLGMVFHIRDARGQRLTGLPDIIAIVGDALGCFETKTINDKVSYRQYAVIDALRAVSRIETGIVRPVPHEGEITLDEALRRLGVEVS